MASSTIEEWPAQARSRQRLGAAGLGLIALSLWPSGAAAQQPLARRYAVGDTIHYQMRAINVEGADTIRYQAAVDGRVVRDSTGLFIEQLIWSHLVRGSASIALPNNAARAGQTLSLASGWQPVPSLSDLDPRLVGPVLDLFTFYVDLKLAASQSAIAKRGDHVYLALGIGGSWADGTRTIVGRDAVDFDVTLEELSRDQATVVVKHLAPAAEKLELPAAWMRDPVGDRPNNWVDVTKTTDGRYRARVGQETFRVDMTISSLDGRLLSATMDNPVDVVERVCTNTALDDCGTPVRYRIRRVISLATQRADRIDP
jgi:hypothetical protein